MASVNFVNEGKTLDALPGANLREIALQAGIPLSSTFHRLVYVNLKLGPFRIFSSSDLVEVEGKGVSNRSETETKALEGRLLTKYKVAPNLRIASQVTITGDISVKTCAAREMDKKQTKEQLGYAIVVTGFGILMLAMFALVGLDLVKKM